MYPTYIQCQLMVLILFFSQFKVSIFFFMANTNGLPLDLYLYQAKGSSIESAMYPTPEKLDFLVVALY